MSCEKSRQTYFEAAALALGAPAAATTLAQIFDAARHKPVPTDTAELKRIDAECRGVWAQMQAAGIKPPSHTVERIADHGGRAHIRPGLPRDGSARHAYAQVSRAVREVLAGAPSHFEAYLLLRAQAAALKAHAQAEVLEQRFGGPETKTQREALAEILRAQVRSTQRVSREGD